LDFPEHQTIGMTHSETDLRSNVQFGESVSYAA
jgi:hypothetical protein